ncbi:MAG: PAS domain-containing protein [Rhodospirillaceae bacterium]|nr:PAS domain-containing protein [Rhodospirillaceae bacterium]
MKRVSPPAIIALYYAAIGVAWILGGSALVDLLLPKDTNLRDEVEIFKGLLYVALTALAVYGFAKWQWRTRVDLVNDLNQSGHRVMSLSNQLTEREALLSATLNSISDHVYVIDRNRKLVTANAPALAAFGLDPARVRGMDLLRFNWPELTFKQIDLDCDFVLSTGHAAYRTISLPTINGPRDFAYAMTPIFGSKEKPDMAVVVARDVSTDAVAA